MYSCKLPGDRWVNLALIRSIEFERGVGFEPVAIVTWDNGDKQMFRDEKAIALIQAWEEAHQMFQQQFQTNT